VRRERDIPQPFPNLFFRSHSIRQKEAPQYAVSCETDRLATRRHTPFNRPQFLMIRSDGVMLPSVQSVAALLRAILVTVVETTCNSEQ
jgi:hypothetical protein